MILPDVNVLVYAFRREADSHEAYAGWLSGVLSAGDEIALVDVVLTGFLRIVTNPRVFADPAPTAAALGFTDVLVGAPRSRWLRGNDAAWRDLASIAAGDRAVRGNLVPDAWIAALARSNGCRVATADRGFARFARLDWFDPADR